jgi:histidinol-phosphate aminotransferase
MSAVPMPAPPIPAYAPGRSAEEVAAAYRLDRVVKLASNESPLGASRLVGEAVARAAGEAHRYPADGAPRLRRRLAERLDVRPEEILVSNGSTEAIQLLVDTFASAGGDVALPAHTFIAYERACRVAGVAVRHAPLRGAEVDLAALAAAVGPDTRLVFLANPNNPTGTAVDRLSLRGFLAALPAHVVVVLDEAYREFAGAAVEDGLALRRLHPRLVLLRTFSKCYGLASLRVGYAVGPAELIAALDRVRDPFNTNALGQVAAEAALEDEVFVRRVVEHNTAARARLVAGLRRAGLRPVPSHANFVLVPLGRPAEPIVEALARRGVIVRSAASSGLPEALRISVGLDEENDLAVAALEATLGAEGAR